jgi:undecaprenyl-diphosphatase
MTRVMTPERVHRQGRPGADREDRVQRYPIDLVRAGLGLAVVGVGFLIAQRGQLPVFERDVFQLVNDLPPVIFPVVWLIMQLGNVFAAPVLAAAAATQRRFRLARDLLVSGLLAYVAADLVKGIVRRERPGGLAEEPFLPEGPIGGLGFISGHAAVAAALATAAVPYLSRRNRRIVWALAWSVALARVYVGAHLPLDIVGGLAAGWAIGSVVHWVFGIARDDPPPERVAALLSRYGLPLRDLRPAAVHARSSHPFVGVDERGRKVYVKFLEPDRLERDWLYRLYRLISVHDVKDADAMAPLGQQAEHEAVAAMTARERGVRAAPVLLARGGRHGAVVAQSYVEGRPLDELPAERFTDDLLGAVWGQVGLLRAGRVAHHDLVASSVLVDDDGRPWIVDFGNAQTGADDTELAEDVGELLVSIALVAEPDDVARTAIATLGADAVAAALPWLAPMTLTAATRAGVRSRPTRVAELRAALQERLTLPDPGRPEFPPAGWAARIAVGAGSILILAGLPVLAGTGVLETLEHDGWRWLGGALVLAVLARAARAAAVQVQVGRRISLGRVFGATMAAEGATPLHGRQGWRLAGTRFLERAGVLPDPANRTVDRVLASTAIAAVLVALGGVVSTLVQGQVSDWEAPEAAVLPAVALGLVSWLLVLSGQWLAGRRPGSPVPMRRAAGGVLPRSAQDFAQLAWAVLMIVLEAATLAAAVHAVDADVPVVTAAGVYAFLRLLWALLPPLGAPGMAELALLLLLAALGASLADACAAVLIFRLPLFWLPAAIGLALERRFERRLPL